MNTYIVSQSEYMTENPDMYAIRAENDEEAIRQVFNCEQSEEPVATVLKQCKEANGNGMPYIMIYNLETHTKIFG